MAFRNNLQLLTKDGRSLKNFYTGIRDSYGFTIRDEVISSTISVSLLEFNVHTVVRMGTHFVGILIPSLLRMTLDLEL